MGLSVSDHNSIYLSTYDGTFRWKIKEPRPGSVQRVNKNGVTVNEMVFDQLSGKLAKITYEEGEEYGASWVLTIVDDKTYKLSLSVNSSSTFYFLNRLINADLDLKAPMLFKIFSEVENDKKKQVILISQGGKYINGVYTKDNPQDLPQMEQIMFKGKLEWDSTRRDQFLRNIIEKYVAPELDAAIAAAPGDGPTDDPDEELPEWAKEQTPPPAATKPEPPKAEPPTPPVAAKPAPKRRG